MRSGDAECYGFCLGCNKLVLSEDWNLDLCSICNAQLPGKRPEYVYEILDAKREDRHNPNLDYVECEGFCTHNYYEELLDDIARNGMKDPIFCEEDGWLANGHHRVAIAEDLGYTYVDVSYDVVYCSTYSEWYQNTTGLDRGPTAVVLSET